MKKFLCVCVLVSALVVPCFSDDDARSRQYEALGMDEVIDAVPDDAAYVEFSDEISLGDGLSEIVGRMSEGIRSAFGSALRCVVTIVAVSVLASAVSALYPGGESPAVKNSISLVSAIAVTGAASGNMLSMIGMGKQFVSDIDLFSKAFLPTIAAAEAACGAAGASVAKASAAVLFSDILITLIRHVFIPLVYINIFAATANAAAENNSLRKISDITVKTVSGALKFLVGIYVAYITVAGIVSGGFDKSGIKTAQFAIGGIPVVGGIISEAAETVIGGALVIKNVIGVFGMLVIVASCVTPLITMGINYIMFKVAGTLASPITGAGVSELSDRLASSFGLVFAMCSTCALLMFIAIVSAMQSVGVL